jgi:hypothetical protein
MQLYLHKDLELRSKHSNEMSRASEISVFYCGENQRYGLVG